MATPISSIAGSNDLASSLAPSGVAQSGVAPAGAVGGTSPARTDVARESVTAASGSGSTSPTSSAADTRLVIEDDKAAGCFVYKIIDRKTGEVVQQLPTEQIVKMRESDGYLAGDVIKSQA